MNRDGLARAFIALADTLVTDFEVVELARQIVRDAMALLPVDEAAIIVPDDDGGLQVLVSDSDRSDLLEMLQIDRHGGPCLQCFRSGEPVVVDDLRDDLQQWPGFGAVAIAHGYLAIHALPLRLHSDHVGVLTLLRFEAGRMTTNDYAIGQALADIAAVGIANRRIALRSSVRALQLQSALKSRTLIEQAKGVLAERGNVGIDQAFDLLRAHARRTNGRLTDIARAIVEGADTAAVFHPHRVRPTPAARDRRLRSAGSAPEE